jgi:hypothetical protein
MTFLLQYLKLEVVYQFFEKHLKIPICCLSFTLNVSSTAINHYPIHTVKKAAIKWTKKSNLGA